MAANFTVRMSLLALTLGWSYMAGAQIAVPPLTGHLTDQTATLTAEQSAALERTLQAFEVRKGSQLAVLIVPTVAPETVEQYALRVAEQWKLGRKKIDDGAILVVAKNERALRIEVGYGLEGALTDAASKRIVSETITPYFQQGDFYGGLTAGIDQMIHVVDGEPLPAATYTGAGGKSKFAQYGPILLILALVLGGALRAWLGRFPGAILTGSAVAVVAWFFAGALSIALVAGGLGLLFTLLTGGMGGLGMLNALGSMAGGGYRGGGFGGGGSGFGGGGGGFGGGGASGRW